MLDNTTPTNTAGDAAVESTENTESLETSTEEVEEVASEDGATGASAETPSDEKSIEKEAKRMEKALKKKLMLKVDGEEYEEEIDFDNEEELKKKLQLARVAQKRMGEKAQLEKDVREFIAELKNNPKKILSDPSLGVDLKKFAASILEEEIANSQKSPELIEKEKLEAELRELKEAQKKQAEEYKQKELEQLYEREFAKLDNQMEKALASTDLPKSEYVVKKMADYMLLGLQNNLDVTPEDVLPIVREDILSDIKSMFGAMPEEVIEKFLGKEITTKMRKKNISKAKAPAAVSKVVPETGTKTESKKDEGKKQTLREYLGI